MNCIKIIGFNSAKLLLGVLNNADGLPEYTDGLRHQMTTIIFNQV